MAKQLVPAQAAATSEALAEEDAVGAASRLVAEAVRDAVAVASAEPDAVPALVASVLEKGVAAAALLAP